MVPNIMIKLTIILTAIILTVSTSFCVAQDTEYKPVVLNQPGEEYPEVNSQGYTRFHGEAYISLHRCYFKINH